MFRSRWGVMSHSVMSHIMYLNILSLVFGFLIISPDDDVGTSKRRNKVFF